MGHNRAGDKARLKQRRRLRQEKRLASKAEQPEKGGVVAQAKEFAAGAAEKVGGLVKAAAKKVKDAVKR